MTESEELLLLRALLRASDFGVLLSDRTRRDILCNRRFCAIFGLQEHEILQAPPESVRAAVVPRLASAEEFLQTLDDIYANPHLTREDEIELIAPRARRVLRYTAPVMDDQGDVIGRLWTFRDITAIRMLEKKVRAQSEELRVQARQLATALRSVSGRLNKVENTLNVTQKQLFESEKLGVVGLLAASVAHDIRNILTPLTIEMALVDRDDPAERAESLAAMRQQVDRLSLVTHRLLALSKPQTMERVPVDVAGLTQRVVALLRPQAALDGVTVLLRCPHRLPPAAADPVQMEQVLVNLMLNGIQAMGAAGGTLAVSLRRLGRAGEPGLSIRIADSGPGIPAAVRRRLFDPFFTTKPDGAGLGLYSCRRIVQAHGGAICITSGNEAGTRVSIWLPCAPAIAAEESHAR